VVPPSLWFNHPFLYKKDAFSAEIALDDQVRSRDDKIVIPGFPPKIYREFLGFEVMLRIPAMTSSQNGEMNQSQFAEQSQKTIRIKWRVIHIAIG